jgi:hypothetical protein
MNSFRKRITTGIFATALITALGSTMPANASTSPPTPVPCGSNTVWLELYATTGVHCYTGNGTAVVGLSVHEMQIVGIHTVCLSSGATTVTCYAGSRTVLFGPPLYIRSVNVSTP